MYFLENICALSQNTFWGTDFFFFLLETCYLKPGAWWAVRIQAGAVFPQHSRRHQAAATGGQHHSAKDLCYKHRLFWETTGIQSVGMARAMQSCPREGLDLVRIVAVMDRAGVLCHHYLPMGEKQSKKLQPFTITKMTS